MPVEIVLQAQLTVSVALPVEVVHLLLVLMVQTMLAATVGMVFPHL
jgi:hypothetical protein